MYGFISHVTDLGFDALLGSCIFGLWEADKLVKSTQKRLTQDSATVNINDVHQYQGVLTCGLLDEHECNLTLLQRTHPHKPQRGGPYLVKTHMSHVSIATYIA